ncbi:MAG: hybrid sensor histidine kinase/response regulator [Myxococcota bacterium]
MARVLHIEDDPHSRRLVEKLLRVAGHEVIDTESGLEGIRLAGEVHPDLVLVDINVPDLDGYEVTLRLRGMSALEGVPIVAVTAEGDRQTSLAVGADGFIAKPIDARRFAATVESFLSGHREQSDDSRETKLREQSSRIALRLEAKLKELVEANRRLEEMARLRREFLQNVSHELATPMTPVVGYLKLLLNQELGPLTELQEKCLRSIERSTQRLRGVTETLLDVSALETGRMHYYDRRYDFGVVAGAALDEMRPVFDKAHVRVVEELSAEPMDARGDPDKLRRALVHVLDNAAKFTPRGGSIAVQTRASGDAYQVLVIDGGPGIDPAERDRIFEPFVQVDGSATRRHGGVGLGLAFARRVTEALGGGVDVVSPPQVTIGGESLEGTQVTVTVAKLAPART